MSRASASNHREDLLEIFRRAGITCTPTSSPTRRAAAAPASVAAFTRADVTSDNRGDQAGVDLLPADEHDVRGLHHRVGGLDHAHESARFDHAERFAAVCLRCHVRSLPRIWLRTTSHLRGCTRRGISHRSLSVCLVESHSAARPLEPLTRSSWPPFDSSASNLCRLSRMLALRDTSPRSAPETRVGGQSLATKRGAPSSRSASGNPPARDDRQGLSRIAVDEPRLIDEIRHHTRMVRNYPNPVARLERRRALLNLDRRMFFRQPLDQQIVDDRPRCRSPASA